jgi:GTPase Era involved in 16S rRNA processing
LTNHDNWVLKIQKKSINGNKMKIDKLTRSERDVLALRQIEHRERQKLAQAKRRAKLKEQGKTQVTLMISTKRTNQIKKLIKILEEKDVERFGLCSWEKREGARDGQPGWYIIYDSKEQNN